MSEWPISPPECPFDSLQSIIAFDPRDWGLYKRDAWMYGIILGWGEDAEPDEDPITELAVMHGWTPDDVARLKRLHAKFEKAEHDHHVAEAAVHVLTMMDHTLGPAWRETTLNQDEDGDVLNAAWDQLVNAVEGSQ